MRILFVSNNKSEEDSLRNQLSEICEKDSITFEYSFESAKDFVDNNIVGNQSPLDLVVCCSKTPDGNANEFRDWLQFDVKRTYSNRDFNLRELPLVVVVGKNENNSMFNGYGWNVDNFDLGKLHLNNSNISSVIRNWRSRVVDELDNLGIKFNSGKVDYSHYFRLEKRIYKSTSILSENFKLLPRTLNYYWLTLNKSQIENAIDEFVRLLKMTERSGKKGDERQFHKFFKANDHFLLRDNYSKFWYEARLKKKDFGYEEPDFVLKPNFSCNTELNVLEVKLPNEGFVNRKKYHPAPLAKFMGHLMQVNDYKDYLESPQYSEVLIKTFGFIPTKVEYTLLIGRENKYLESINEIMKFKRRFGQEFLNVLTYDDLKEYQVRFLDRIGVLEIK